MKKSALVADWNTLMRTFLRPDDERTKATLIKYMEQIQFGLHDFLKAHVGITEEVSLKELSNNLSDTRISTNPEKKLADVITDLIEDIAPHAVNITSPYFVGHMTSAIPFFMIHLKTIVAALNQNVNKLETSKVCSVLEKQVLAKIHRMIYQRSESFYKKHVQNTESTLGSFIEGGTLANVTALWVARNRLFSPKNKFTSIEEQGIQAAYNAHGVERCVVLVSRLGHYSLRKAGGLLGLGNKNIIPIDIDQNNRVDLKALNNQLKEIDQHNGKIRILAIIGVAGATETGTIDPLKKLGEICKERKIHFHVDAAWGGPVILSEKYRHLLDGIEMADSITIDGHKQFYMPMGCGMVYFKDPYAMDVVAYHANYINRPGSVDLGIKSLSGSREANSLILDSALKIMGSKGYSLLYEHGIETAREFAKEIDKRPLFEVVTKPELNILTYRLCPGAKGMLANKRNPIDEKANEELNEINRTVQRLQREAGNSFVSRTTLKTINGYSGKNIVVFRCVIMNPMTNINILREILDEQEDIYRRAFT
jgi:glutamate decarboxylase